MKRLPIERQGYRILTTNTNNMEATQETINALHKVQQQLKVPKDKCNTFGGFNYRSCESILEAVKKLLEETGATLCLSDEVKEIGGEKYIQATAMFICGGGMIQTTAYAREEKTKKGMDAAQITGACSSYARKYALNGLFAIDDAKDPDMDEYQKQTRQAQPKKVEPKKAAEQSLPLNESIASVQARVRAAETLEELADIYREVKADDEDLANLMKVDFTNRKKQLQNL